MKLRTKYLQQLSEILTRLKHKIQRMLKKLLKINLGKKYISNMYLAKKN